MRIGLPWADELLSTGVRVLWTRDRPGCVLLGLWGASLCPGLSILRSNVCSVWLYEEDLTCAVYERMSVAFVSAACSCSLATKPESDLPWWYPGSQHRTESIIARNKWPVLSMLSTVNKLNL
jgi:hypothetical protein